MNDKIITALGVMIPLLGTVAGAGMVFFLKSEMKPFLQKALLGFASGVMIAASIWSLLIPAIDMAAASGVIPWFPAAIGFLSGITFLLVLDSLIPHLHLGSNTPEGKTSGTTRGIGKSLMLILAVTLHNIPEGMAVGVVFAGMLSENAVITAAGALALSIGIAIQNFPEGAIISMPLIASGMSKKRAFTYGMLSGVVEPVGALITIMLTAFVEPILPYILAFAAGAMIYVVVEELIPESQQGEHSNIGTIGVALGFTLMMVLDVALG
ncbi:MAG: ZIP family metal transporter [Eubacteriaceae bacterium]|nr:ZIP family metal transporter [Eubacteriaceae bacterium]